MHVELRRAPRIRARLDVMFVHDRVDSSGTVVDISRSGAHIAAAKRRIPPLGSAVHLIIAAGGGRQVELDASVARHTPEGFGAHFRASPLDLLQLLVDLGGDALEPV